MPEPLFRDSPRSRAIRQLCAWIESGALPAGQPLPTERELADRLDLPRSTVARAIDAVIARGLVRAEGGHSRVVVGPGRRGALAGTVAVVASPLDEARRPETPSWMEWVTAAVLAELRSQSLDALVLDARRSDAASLERLAAEGLSGVLVTAGSGRPRIDPEAMRDCLLPLAARGVPSVIFGDESGERLDRVASDHEAGADAATAHLLSRGCRRPLQLFGATIEHAWTAQRRRGYERAMRRAGLEPLPPVLVPELAASSDAGTTPEQQARHLLGHLYEHLGPQAEPAADGLVLLTDYEAAGVARACALLGRSVPLVGYDACAGLWRSPGRWDPAPLAATVDKRLWDCGIEMVRLLRWRQEIGSGPEPRRVAVEPQLLTA